MIRPSRWFARLEGDLVEVRRLTRPHRERSLVLCLRLDRPATMLLEARDLIQS